MQYRLDTLVERISMKQNTVSPALTLELKSNAAPRLFGFTVFYRDRGLKHEHVTDFNGRDRLLSSLIINEF